MGRAVFTRGLGLALLLALWPGPARAEVTVPIDLQVDLLRKLLRFERGFATRCHTEVPVLIVVRSGNAASVRAADELRNQLEHAHDLGGKPVRVQVHVFSSVSELKTAAENAHALLLIVTPGFDEEIATVAAAFVDQPIITVTTDGEQVPRGMVIGFELISSKPKIYLNLGQARRQRLDFNSELFRLARVFQ